MTLPECMTLADIFATTIFSVKLMNNCTYLWHGWQSELLQIFSPLTPVLYSKCHLGSVLAPSARGTPPSGSLQPQLVTTRYGHYQHKMTIGLIIIMSKLCGFFPQTQRFINVLSCNSSSVFEMNGT